MCKSLQLRKDSANNSWLPVLGQTAQEWATNNIKSKFVELNVDDRGRRCDQRCFSWEPRLYRRAPAMMKGNEAFFVFITQKSLDTVDNLKVKSTLHEPKILWVNQLYHDIITVQLINRHWPCWLGHIVHISTNASAIKVHWKYNNTLWEQQTRDRPTFAR